jgi:hypothetical protein
MALRHSLDDPDLTAYERSVLGNETLAPRVEKLTIGPYQEFSFLPHEKQRIRDAWKEVQGARRYKARMLKKWRSVKNDLFSSFGERHAAMAQYEIAGEDLASAVETYEKARDEVDEVSNKRGDEQTAAA